MKRIWRIFPKKSASRSRSIPWKTWGTLSRSICGTRRSRTDDYCFQREDRKTLAFSSRLDLSTRAGKLGRLRPSGAPPPAGMPGQLEGGVSRFSPPVGADRTVTRLGAGPLLERGAAVLAESPLERGWARRFGGG